MKTIFRLYTLLVLVAFVLNGCSDDSEPKNPYEGTDNFIESVVISQDGKEYRAIINGDSITVTIPYTLSLDKANATFICSENTTIYPDPAEITDWDRERQFRVTSYNNKDKRYVYRVVKADIATEADVILSTQAEVDAFAQSGTTIINGNLIIGKTNGKEEITSIKGLKTITEVKGSIIINDLFTGEDLIGLENLVKAGSIKIGTGSTVSKAPKLYFINFPALQEITSDFIIKNNIVQWIQASKLTSVGESVELNSTALTSITLPVLKKIGMNLELKGSTTAKAGGDITEIALPELETVSGNFSVSYFQAVTEIKLPMLSFIGGDVLFTTFTALPQLELTKLTTAKDIRLIELPELVTLSFPELTSAGSFITFDGTYDAKQSTDIQKLAQLSMPKLKSIEGDLLLTENKIADIDASLPSLESISGNLSLYKMDVTSISVINNLKNLGGNLVLSYLKNFSGELRLTSNGFKGDMLQLVGTPITKITGSDSFKGSIVINYSAIPEISGISYPKSFLVNFINAGSNIPALNFKEIKDTLSIQAIPTDCGDISFPQLEKVGGYIHLNGANSICNSISMPKLKEVGSQLFINKINPKAVFVPLLEEVGTGNNQTYATLSSQAVHLDCKELETLEFPSLKTIKGRGLNVFVYPSSLTTISAPLLTSVEGSVLIGSNNKVNANNSLKTLNFPLLTSVLNISILHNSNFGDFSTFATLAPQLKASTWTVTNCQYMPSYEDMKNGYYTQELKDEASQR